MTRSIVVTTINDPTPSILELARLAPEWRILVVGDRKTPENWQCEGIEYFSVSAQNMIDLELASLLPENHYARKNLGYLESMRGGALVIAETDDDNSPENWPRGIQPRNMELEVAYGRDWINPYPYFTSRAIWPRGLPLDEVLPSLIAAPTRRESVSSPIHQYLAAGDPDVDAIYRLVYGDVDHEYTKGSVAIAPGCFTTFNSQSTIWYEEAFTLMYLPSYVSFRMTDIWRSLVAQVCLWRDGSVLTYFSEGVRQVRNEHDLTRDFADEVPGYLQNKNIARALLAADLSGGIGDRLRACYVALVDEEIIPERELELVDAWLRDLDKVRQG